MYFMYEQASKWNSNHLKLYVAKSHEICVILGHWVFKYGRHKKQEG